MPRSFAPGFLPPDREFTPRSAADVAGIAADDAAYAAADLAEPYTATTIQKIEYYQSKGQKMANDNNCGVLVHYFVIPGFQGIPPTMAAVLVPANESATEPA